jgi:dihydrofolate reductase
MRKVVVDEFLTLDGVAQAPGGEEEDQDGGFAHGGWQFRGPTSNEVSQWALGNIREAGGFLLGRRTWQIFAGYWPNAGEELQDIAAPLNEKPKHVVTRTLTEPLGWENSRVVPDLEAVAALKQEDGGDLHTIGSTGLVRALFGHGLVDELRLVTYPVVVGGGKRIFDDDGRFSALELVDSRTTSLGAIISTYAPKG